MFISLLEQNPYLLEVIHTLPTLNLPNSFVAGACIAQTLWNLRHGFSPEAHLKDIDLVYFDPTDVSEESEAHHQAHIQKKFAHIPIPIDVKNEARVHLWYKEKFGYVIKPYASCEEAISTFPITLYFHYSPSLRGSVDSVFRINTVKHCIIPEAISLR